MQKKIVKGFTLIELLVVIAIIGILSGTGIVAYNGYTSAAKESATKSNHKKIVNNMESEFAKCKLDKSSKIFNSHKCDSSNRPSTGTINNYVNSLGLKNPYDKKLYLMDGEPPDPTEIGRGCSFNSRCPNPTKECKEGSVEMGLIEVESGHWVDKCCVNCS